MFWAHFLRCSVESSLLNINAAVAIWLQDCFDSNEIATFSELSALWFDRATQAWRRSIVLRQVKTTTTRCWQFIRLVKSINHKYFYVYRHSGDVCMFNRFVGGLRMNRHKCPFNAKSKLPTEQVLNWEHSHRNRLVKAVHAQADCQVDEDVSQHQSRDLNRARNYHFINLQNAKNHLGEHFIHRVTP